VLKIAEVKIFPYLFHCSIDFNKPMLVSFTVHFRKVMSKGISLSLIKKLEMLLEN
jgi:hypothetical protein